MTTSQTSSSQDFFAKLETLSSAKANAPCFLLGNGISRYLCSAPSWDEVLCRLEKTAFGSSPNDLDDQSSQQEKAAGLAGMNHPECYTAMLVQAGLRKSRDTLKKELKKLLGARGDCGLLSYVRRAELQVLTINFEDVIERALGLLSSGRENSGHFSEAKGEFHSEYYPFQQYVAKEQRTDLPLESEAKVKGKTKRCVADHCAVWHIHGNLNHSKSILLGFEDYISAILYVRDKVLKNPAVKSGFAEPWEEGFKGKNTWLRLFFTRPLVIAGCGIESEELFLRWLLLRRCRRTRLENLSERLPIFYLATPSTEDESKYKSKKKYFEQLGIQVVEFDDYASLYDAPEWKKLAR